MTNARSAVRLVGISSSPRHGNTEILLREALQAAQEAYPEIAIEMISFKGKKIRPCYDCKACERRETANLWEQCVLKDDWVELVRPLVDPVPNGIIIASPVYFSDVNSALRAFMERCTSLLKPYWFPQLPFKPPDFSRTAGGALAVGFHRHGGQETAILTILRFFVIVGIAAVGSVCPENGPIGYYGGAAWEDVTGEAGRKGVLKDRWGLYSARVLGRRVAHAALLLANAPDIPMVSEPFVPHYEPHPSVNSIETGVR
jgi:multimeric flavodoxin WrbA